MDKEIVWLALQESKLLMFYENKWFASIAVLLFFLALRWVLVRIVKKYRKGGEEFSSKRWINVINNLTSLFTIITLIVIWLSELRFIALSIAAFAVALVVATREQIQCFLGAFYIAGSRAFGVGDWVSVNNIQGEIVSSDWLTTTLLEIDLENKSYSYTGKTLVVANYVFIGNTVRNLNFMRRYVAHSFDIVRDDDFIDIRQARQFLLERIGERCQEFYPVAERYGALIEKKLGVDLNLNDYSVRVKTNSNAKNIFSISFFCPTQDAVRIEQALIEDFMEYWYEKTHHSRRVELKKDSIEFEATQIA